MGEIRITGGEFKGRRLKVPRGVRPSSSRLREALFSILAGRLEGALVLDLFAGSGSIGLEALSRGAAGAVFVEKGGGQMAVLRKNIASIGIAGRARAVKVDWRKGVSILAGEGKRFDVILADPPYGFWDDGRQKTKLLRMASDFDIVSNNGILVIERPARAPLPDEAPGLERILEREYGDSALTFYGKGGTS